MGIAYDRADKEQRELLQTILHAHHPCLTYVETKVAIITAIHRTEKEGATGEPAVKLNGYPCAAVIKINSLKHRLQGMADATITVDNYIWKEQLDDDSRAALIDHELEHLEVKAEEKSILRYDEESGSIIGVPLSDDIGRPKLQMRLHDWQLGGFTSIAKRHRGHALEVMAARMHLDPATDQYVWDFAQGADASKTRKGSS